MRVFVAGATGVIGRVLVPMLREAGHDVVGMTRSEERAADLREQGVEAAVCDAFDADGVARAVAAARPEVVVNQLTDIPKVIEPRKMGDQFEMNDRLRTEGTRNLMRAAEAAGARRLVSQSIAFAYAPAGTLRAEDDPLFDDAPPPWGRSVAAVRALERETLGSASVEGVVLRYGYFYGPGTVYAGDGSTAAMVRKRGFPVVGRGTAVYSFIHIDDAAVGDGRRARPRRARDLQRRRRRARARAGSGCPSTPPRSRRARRGRCRGSRRGSWPVGWPST